MRVLIALSRFMLGGTETYSVTVAEQLERLGHPVELWAAEASESGAALARSRALPLRIGPLPPPGDYEAALVQDAAAANLLAERLPEVRQVFVAHGLSAYEHPPATLRMPVVALNGRIGGHLEALAAAPPLLRLRQPLDLERLRPRGAARPRAERVLALSNYMPPERLAMLESACAELGLELTRVGADAADADPLGAIADADVVVGYGRSVLEGMAMGRAAYVWDRAGGDGWVTPASYPRLEADGFAGAATDAVIDAERLRSDLAAYTPEMGTLAYDLARQHHSATKHTEALVRLLGATEPPASASAPAHDELARLVRLEARAAIRLEGLEASDGQMREEVGRLRRELDAATRAAAAAEAGRRAAEADREQAEGRFAEIAGSRSWRLLAPLHRLAARWRPRPGRSR